MSEETNPIYHFTDAHLAALRDANIPGLVFGDGQYTAGYGHVLDSPGKVLFIVKVKEAVSVGQFPETDNIDRPVFKLCFKTPESLVVFTSWCHSLMLQRNGDIEEAGRVLLYNKILVGLEELQKANVDAISPRLLVEATALAKELIAVLGTSFDVDVVSATMGEISFHFKDRPLQIAVKEGWGVYLSCTDDVSENRFYLSFPYPMNLKYVANVIAHNLVLLEVKAHA